MHPREQVEKIEKHFKKIPPLPRKEKALSVPIAILLLVSLAIVAILTPLKPKIKNQVEKMNRGMNREDTTQKNKKEKTESGKEKKTICVLRVPFDPEIIKIAFENNIEDINIRIKEKHGINKINFFIGDFANIEDVAIVSARLSEKGIPHKIEKIQEKWRVYVQISMKFEQEVSLKERITREDIDEIRKRASKITGEIVDIQIEKEDQIIPIAVLNIEDKEKCMELYEKMKDLGKKVERELFILSSLTGQI